MSQPWYKLHQIKCYTSMLSLVLTIISTEPTLNGDDDAKLKLPRKTRALLVVVQT